MEFSPQSHWRFLFFFKGLAEQSTAGQLLTQVCKTPLHFEPTQNVVGVTRTLLVTGKSWWHLPEGQFCGNTSAARSSLHPELSDELCSVTQVIALAGVLPTFDSSTDISVFFLEIRRRLLYTYLPDSKRKVRSSSSVLTSLFGTAAAPHTLCTVNSCQVLFLHFPPLPPTPGHLRAPWRHLALPSILSQSHWGTGLWIMSGVVSAIPATSPSL